MTRVRAPLVLSALVLLLLAPTLPLAAAAAANESSDVSESTAPLQAATPQSEVHAFRARIDGAVALYAEAHANLSQDEAAARAGMRAAAREVAETFFEFERGHGNDTSLSVFMQTRMPGSYYTTFERNVVLLRGAMQPREGVEPTPVAEVEQQANLVRLSLTRAESCMPDGCRAGPVGLGAEAFLLIVREGFEAILIVGAIIAYLRKSERADKARVVYMGVAAALALTAVTWFALRALFSGAVGADFVTREILEGASMLLAAGVLFYVSYWLLSKVESRHWQAYLDGRLRDSLAHGRAWSLGLVGFLAVYREGLETALFFQGLLARADNGTGSIVGGSLAAVAVLAVLYYAIHTLGVKIPLRRFFTATSALLYVMAIRFTGLGLFALQEAGALQATPLYAMAGTLAQRPLLGVLLQDVLGFAPTLEVLLGQLALVLAAVGGFAYSRLRPAPVNPAAQDG